MTGDLPAPHRWAAEYLPGWEWSPGLWENTNQANKWNKTFSSCCPERPTSLRTCLTRRAPCPPSPPPPGPPPPPPPISTGGAGTNSEEVEDAHDYQIFFLRVQFVSKLISNEWSQRWVMQFFKFINVFTDYDMTTDMSLTGHNPNVITLYAVQANKCQSLVLWAQSYLE